MKNINYTPEHLDILKKIFYPENHESVTTEVQNIGLNTFFGNEPKDTLDWKSSFKNKIYEALPQNKGLKKKPTQSALKQITDKNFLQIDSSILINAGSTKQEDIHIELNNFLDDLKEKLPQGSKLNQTLIYEAPPYKITYDPNTQKAKFIAKFIFDGDCSSAYAQSINDWGEDKGKNPSEILAEQNTGFFDIIPIPLPISYGLRTSWATDKKFIIKKKRIFMHFFDWAKEDYIKRLKAKGINLDKNHRVAIGVPLNNAVTLYEYYESNPPNGKDDLLRHILTPNDFQNKDGNLGGMWLQHYKSSIISPGNKPVGKLIKNAFS